MKRILSFSFLLMIILIIIATSNNVLAQVTESWASRYNGPGSGTDQANAIVVDASGNVYVTGYSYGSTPFWDYATIKYDSAGVLQWVQRYDGPGSSFDIAYAIAADDLGFIYVTGGSYGSAGNYDYLTIKYSSSGDTVWTRRYNGPRNALDKAYSIVLDDTGNVYITGESEGLTGTHGIFEDYATIKYSTDGTLRWVARYNGPIGDYDRANAITIDDSGNVYVTGTSDGGSSGSGDPYLDYATLKYNNSGVVQWIKRYKGFGTSNDEAKAIEVDMTGNILVTGFSYGNYLTIKYNFTGDTLWTRSYNGPADYTDKANDLAIDDLGNVYVTGSSYGGVGANYDYATIKYNSDGDSIWVNRYNGPSSDIDEGISIALDKFYNVYVTGRSDGLSYDYATIKYNSVGDENWVVRYSNGGSGSSSDEASSIYVDTLSNVYVTGMSALDYATVKYVVIIPVELVSFNASVANNKVNLNWSTATETNNSGFQIERSSGSEFQVVGFVTGHGTTTERQNYIFTDDNVNSGKYTYRLKQIDFNGTYEYSKTIEVQVTSPLEFSIDQNYPNPFNPSTRIKYQVPSISHVTIKVYDVLGNEVATLVNEEKPAGNYEIKFDAVLLSSGIYLYKLQAGNFVETRKMILLK